MSFTVSFSVLPPNQSPVELNVGALRFGFLGHLGLSWTELFNLNIRGHLKEVTSTLQILRTPLRQRSTKLYTHSTVRNEPSTFYGRHQRILLARVLAEGITFIRMKYQQMFQRGERAIDPSATMDKRPPILKTQLNNGQSAWCRTRPVSRDDHPMSFCLSVHQERSHVPRSWPKVFFCFSIVLAVGDGEVAQSLILSLEELLLLAGAGSTEIVCFFCRRSTKYF